MIKVDKQSNSGLKMKEFMFNEEFFEASVEKFTSVVFFILLGLGIPFMIHIILQLL